MSALKDISKWSKTAPNWQRDALRRLLSQRKLSDADLAELAKLCKAAHGLTSPDDNLPEAKLLAEEHPPADVQINSPVALVAIRNIQDVNIILSKQPLTFGASGLSVVYGDNASGRSGYLRQIQS